MITLLNSKNVVFESEMTFQEVSELYIKSLDTIGKFVVSHPDNVFTSDVTSQKLSGRDGSTYFENNVAKKIINKNFSKIKINLKKIHNIDLIEIDAPVANNEAETRGKYDLSITIQIKDKKGNYHSVRQFVNIKFTKGGTNDNTGGKEVLSRSILNMESSTLNILDLITLCSKSISDTNMPTPYSDYFFLSFRKSDAKPSDCSSVKSILTNDWNGLDSSCVFNITQTFPHIQMAFSSNPIYNFHNDLNSSRKVLLEWLVSKLVTSKSQEFAQLLLIGRNMGMQFKA